MSPSVTWQSQRRSTTSALSSPLCRGDRRSSRPAAPRCPCSPSIFEKPTGGCRRPRAILSYSVASAAVPRYISTDFSLVSFVYYACILLFHRRMAATRIFCRGATPFCPRALRTRTRQSRVIHPNNHILPCSLCIRKLVADCSRIRWWRRKFLWSTWVVPRGACSICLFRGELLTVEAFVCAVGKERKLF